MTNRDSVDRGWAWIVLAACFLRTFLVIGLNKSFGMFFVEYVEAFGSNSSMISTILAVQQIMFSVSSFFILTVGHRFFSIRPIVIFGSVLMAVGFLLNAMAPNVEFLFLSQGVLFGIGQAAASGPSVVALNSYFDKRRGMANSLSNCGGSLGGLFLPLIIQILLETYALSGAQIIVSALLLNIVVSGALMRPLQNKEPSEKLNIEINTDDADDNKFQHNNGNHISVDLNHVDLSLSVDDIRLTKNKDDKADINANGSNKPLLTLVPNNYQYRMRTFSENLHEHRHTTISEKTKIPNSADESRLAKLSVIYGSLADVTSSIQSMFLAKTTNTNLDTEETPSESEKCLCKYCLNIVNFRILKNHHLKFIFLVGFLAVYGCRLQMTYIPPFARDRGISSRNISYLVTIVGTCDFASRFAVAWIADSKRFRRNHILAVSLIIAGAASMLNSFIRDFPTFIALCVIYGLFGGLYNAFFPLLLVECVGAKNISTALAFSIQIHGISIGSVAPVLGIIRDTVGSYSGSFYIMGAGMISSAILLLFVEPIVKKMESKRKQKCLGSHEG